MCVGGARAQGVCNLRRVLSAGEQRVSDVAARGEQADVHNGLLMMRVDSNNEVMNIGLESVEFNGESMSQRAPIRMSKRATDMTIHSKPNSFWVKTCRAYPKR